MQASRFRYLAVQCRRFQSTQVGNVREELMTSLKTAMKTKDTLTSTTLRSVLSEVYAADKTDKTGKLSSSAILTILRKAKQRREDTAVQYIAAERPELAEKEHNEAQVLQKLLPPLLPVEDIDTHLKALLEEQKLSGSELHPKKLQGVLLKAFYERVDRGMVNSSLVVQRTVALLQA